MTLNDGVVDLEVVIPTRDRPSQLTNCLKSLADQTFERFGVIVVDDGGERPAERLVPAETREVLAVRFVRNRTAIGAGASRNRGVNESQAPYLVFLDDDCIASPELIARHLKALTSPPGPVVSLGPIMAPPERRMPVWIHWDADRWEQHYRRLGSGQSSPGWENLFTGNVGLRREDFHAVEGFDESLSRQEDIELGYRLDRLGCRFRFDPSANVWHDSQRTLGAWMRMPSVAAHFDVELDRRFPDSRRLIAVRERLGRTHWALRLARRMVRASLARRLLISCAVAVGCVLHAVRADRAALAAFSLVWDLSYWEALRKACSAPGR